MEVRVLLLITAVALPGRQVSEACFFKISRNERPFLTDTVTKVDIDKPKMDCIKGYEYQCRENCRKLTSHGFVTGICFMGRTMLQHSTKKRYRCGCFSVCLHTALNCQSETSDELRKWLELQDQMTSEIITNKERRRKKRKLRIRRIHLKKIYNRTSLQIDK